MRVITIQYAIPEKVFKKAFRAGKGAILLSEEFLRMEISTCGKKFVPFNISTGLSVDKKLVVKCRKELEAKRVNNV